MPTKQSGPALPDSFARVKGIEAYVRPAKVANAIKLDSNENMALERSIVAGALAEAARAADLREYPLEELDSLYAGLERYTGLDRKYICAGSGSDQIIELVLSSLGGRGSKATVFSPTFSYFVSRCRLHDIKIESVPLKKDDFALETKKFVSSAKNSDLVYICSPNNPTGNQIDRQDVLSVLDSVPVNTIVLLDEAYVEFADYSLSSEAVKRGNLFVLRTLSKAFGLAGARVGYMLTNSRAAEIFRSTIQSPYPISTVSLLTATAVLAKADKVLDSVRLVRSERARMLERLSGASRVKLFASDSNFLFIAAGRNAGAIISDLASENIVVKSLGDVAGYRGCLRITIATPDINDSVLRCILRA